MNLLERDSMFRDLHDAMLEADAGQSRMLLLGGEAGVGKSSIVRHLAERERRTARVLIGACDPLSSPHPLGPLQDVVSSMHSRVADLFQHPDQRRELFAAVLDDLNSKPATLFIIEDAHWADEATLDLLRYLGRRIDRTRALLLVTYRNDEPGANRPMRVLLGDLATAQQVRRMGIYPLSEAAVSTLAAGSAFDAADLHRRTGGNPFFVTEVLESGGLGVPATVRDAVLARVARLSADGRELLETAAVIGSRIEQELLLNVSQTSANAYDECLDSGILQFNDNMLTFRHELSRQCVLEAISPGRLTAIHASVLSELRSAGSRDFLVRLAHHAEASGDGSAVLEFAPEAARRAAELGAHREAASQYARALRFAGGLQTVERERLLAAHLGECHLTGNSVDELTSINALIAIAQSNGNRRAEARWQAWLASVLVTSGQNDAAEAASLSALDLLEDEPATTEKLYAYSVQATIRMLNRDGSEAVSWGERTLAMADKLGDVPASIKALNAIGSARIVGGEITQGTADLEKSLAMAREQELDGDVAGAFTNLGSALGEMYRFEDAEHYLIDGIAFTDERDLDRSGVYMTSWLALTRVYQGRWTEATELANRVLRNPTAIAISRIMALVALGRLRARRGDPEVMTALDEALELASTTRTLQRLGPVRAARAEAAWLAGRTNLVAEEASAVFDLAMHHRHPWHIGELGFWLWRAGAIDEPPTNAAEPFARQITGDWSGAASCWRELGCPYETARAFGDSADEAALKEALSGFDLLGARPAMLGVTNRLRDIGIVHIPRGPRSSTRANPAGLTSREVDVLKQLVQGSSNAEIASALFLSSKTVEHHVTAILTKLNVNTRREAANRAVEAHLIP